MYLIDYQITIFYFKVSNFTSFSQNSLKMKLYPAHYLDLKEVMEKHGISIKNYSFQKKKGRIRIENKLNKSFFQYFHINKTIWNQDRTGFKEVDKFEIHHNHSKKYYVPNWKHVKKEFNIWLKIT